MQTKHILLHDAEQSSLKQFLSNMADAPFEFEATHVTELESLKSVFEDKDWDIIVTHDNHQTPASNTVQMLQQYETDVPIIVLIDQYDEGKIDELIMLGAKDSVLHKEKHHLKLAIEREINHYENICQKKQAEMVLHSLAKQNLELLDWACNAIAFLVPENYLFLNPHYRKLFHIPIKEKSMQIFPELHFKQDAIEKIREFYNRSIEHGLCEERVTLDIICFDGKEKQHDFILRRSFFDQQSCIQLISTEEILADKNYSDILTGLQNRSYLEETLSWLVNISQDQAQEHELLIIGLDNFAELKHIRGVDLFLKAVSEELLAFASSTRVIARLHSNVFAIVTPDTPTLSALELGEQIRYSIEKLDHSPHIQTNHQTTCSVVSVPIKHNIHSAIEFLNKTEQACYRLQVHGGNQIQALNSMSEIRQPKYEDTLAKTASAALKHGNCHLVFQPIVTLHGEPKEYYEALIRMENDDGIPLSVADIFSIHEDKSLLLHIDQWVLEHAIMQLVNHRAKEHDAGLFIIASQTTIDNHNEILPWLNNLLSHHQCPADALVVQVRESVLLKDQAKTIEFIHGLDQLHCQIALTHCHMKPETLKLLRELPIKYVKFDGQLSYKLTKDKTGEYQLKSYVDNLHSLSKLVMVPLVEQANSLAALWRSNVNYVQGYYLQAPQDVLEYNFEAHNV